jgi:hypothetical protein
MHNDAQVELAHIDSVLTVGQNGLICLSKAVIGRGWLAAPVGLARSPGVSCRSA